MPSIEDYALLGDCRSAALVHKDGSINWACLPRFDSDACFANLLGTNDNGTWALAPSSRAKITRRYLPDTMVLETVFQTASGRVTLTDAMHIDSDNPAILRQLRCEAGAVHMAMRIAPMFEYGVARPLLEQCAHGVHFVQGGTALTLQTETKLRLHDGEALADFTLHSGEQAAFALHWSDAFQRHRVPRFSVTAALLRTEKWWRQWAGQCEYEGEWQNEVRRSLLVLKALSHGQTGGIVAAPTTSLPERIGGERNWDYRFCWLRDATFTLYSLHQAGYHAEAKAWHRWLRHAIGGDPEKAQVLYAVDGHRHSAEIELPWLQGFAGSRPVRIGNAAAGQFQLDIFGEVVNALYHARGLYRGEDEWNLERALVEHTARVWQQPDNGIWEVRGQRQHFVYSKVMAWVALDRGVKLAHALGQRTAWAKTRDRIQRAIMKRGFNARLGAFTEAFDSTTLDAAVLRMPLVGFISPSDARWQSTVRAIEKKLMGHGFVRRCASEKSMFIPCAFWLVSNFQMIGEEDKARALFAKACGAANDLGLLSEEYDATKKRQLGNFPQVISHVSLINAAFHLSGADARR